jgi:hypothetical protein
VGPKKSDTRRVARSDAVKSLGKCAEFLAGATASLDACRWNAAGLDAIHAGIAAADAALIASCGIRSVSDDHGAVVRLLDGRLGSFSAAQRRQMHGLLRMKNVVAYEQRLLTDTEARQLVDHARRLERWSSSVCRDFM